MFRWTFCNDYRFAILSKSYLTVVRIIMQIDRTILLCLIYRKELPVTDAQTDPNIRKASLFKKNGEELSTRFSIILGFAKILHSSILALSWSKTF